MREALDIQPFAIRMDHVAPRDQAFCESLFSQGNGYMGVRGYDPLGKKTDDHTRSVFIAGFFESIKHGITDMVNTPDVFSTPLHTKAKELDASLILDLRTGLWQREALWETAQGQRFAVTTQRIVSMANKHITAMRLKLTALEQPVSLTLSTGLDDGVANLPISDDQMSANTKELRLLRRVSAASHDNGGSLVMASIPSGRCLYQAYGLKVTGGAAVGGEGAYTHIQGMLQADETLVIDKLTATCTYRDGQNASLAAAESLCARATEQGFDAVYQASAQAWAALWETCDIQVEAAGDLQGAIRYNLFQLLQNNAAEDPHVSIGARGLMHGRYKGNYFWDTELFMLPFYLYTRPLAAKNLLLYRYHTLADAIQGAKAMGLSGARYPWMCSNTGFEQCETWDTGCCEIHITADVAHAVSQYCAVTGDTPFFIRHGAEMLLQTARYWLSRLNYCAKDDCYHLLFVKGPDEYCGVTSNNTYTNYLCRENLLAAAQAGEALQQIAPERWHALCKAHGFSAAELETFRTTAMKVVIRYDQERDLFLEDDLFEKLEPLNVAAHKQGDIPLYRTMSYDRLQRYQVCKQADLVLLMTLYPHAFTKAQKQQVYTYYEPKTLHDSTLSFGTHAQLAFRLGLDEDAMKYFDKSVYLDLKDVMENTAEEGIHMAALGASWQAIIFGMLGLSITHGKPDLQPRLPANIRAIRTQIMVNGKAYCLRAEHGACAVTPRE